MRRSVGAMSLAVALIVAAGCGGGGSDGDGGGVTGPEPADSSADEAAGGDGETATESTDAVAEPEDSPIVTSPPTSAEQDGGAVVDAPSGALVVGLATDLQTFDPHLAQPAQLHYLDLVYDALTDIGPDGAVVPQLAASMVSDDLTTWTVDLVPNATFASGAPVDADAVVSSLERGRGIVESPSAAVLSNIASLNAEDEDTVTIVLARPDVTFPRSMAGLAGMIVDPAAAGSDLARAPAGAGPYVFDRAASVEGSSYHYTARSDYAGAPVGAAEITLSVLTDPTARVNALASGQLDVAAELGPADQNRLSGDTELVIAPTSEQLYLQILDTEGRLVPALADQRVREAISLAIDREGIRDAIFFGRGIATTAFFAEGSPYYAEEVDAVGYDPERARELLADAGYADGFAFSTPTVDALRTVTEAVASMLGQVGISMSIELQQPGTLGQQMRDGQWPLNLTLARGQTAPAFYADRLAPDAPFNAFDADRSTVAALAETARAATTEAEADAAWADVFAEAVRQGYVVVVGHITTGAGVSEGVTGGTIPFGSLVPDLRRLRPEG